MSASRTPARMTLWSVRSTTSKKECRSGTIGALLAFHCKPPGAHTLFGRSLLTSEASSRRGPQYTPLLAAAKALSAACVLPEFVGPT